MKSKFFAFIIVAIVVVLTTATASANVLTSTGITVISPPASVAKNGTESNETMFLFAERQDFILTADLVVDITTPGTYGGSTESTIPAGTCVNSYFIHYDRVRGNQYRDADATFEEPVLGLITSNLNLDDSDWLGAPGTFYGNSITDGEIYRGLELTSLNQPDSLTFSADLRTVSVHLIVKANWQDQFRVITEGNCEPVIPDDLTVQIDVKPNSDPSCFNSNGVGVIPVAILGTGDFDVTLIDPASLELDGAPIATRRSGKPKIGYEDYNNDGYKDLVAKFVDTDNYTKLDEWAELTGVLLDGTPITGIGDICIRP
jgi:hypothetical protein